VLFLHVFVQCRGNSQLFVCNVTSSSYEYKTSDTDPGVFMDIRVYTVFGISVADPDPDPDPKDPYVFGPPWIRNLHPDSLVTSTDPAPAPSSGKNSKKNLDFYYFVISL
jgi:hypothetical protein